MNKILKAALEYLDLGISVIPIIPRDKKPLIPWQEFQRRLPTEDEVYSWFECHPERNLAIVCGPVSGDLVVVDIDGRDGMTWAKENLPATSVYSKTPKNEFTFHGYYRGKGIRNGKPHPQVDIRGDGGYVVAPPSTHPNGGQYELTIMEHTQGWKGLAEYKNTSIGLDLSSIKTAPTMEPKQEGSRNQSLASLVGRWCSKGLDLAEVLALAQSWNTGNTPPLETKELFRTVQSIVETHNRNHPGSMVESGESDLPEVDLGNETEEDKIPEELLNPGGIMQKVMEYTDKTNATSVPIFALAGAIALMGTVCGQRVMTQTGLRTNNYVISLGYSAAGKNAACEAIPQILLHAARDAIGPTELASAQSLLRWLATDHHHVSLVCLDEIGMLMKGIRFPESPKADIPRVLTRLFSSTNRPESKSFADVKLNFTVPYHCLSLYGASTPSEFWKGINVDDASSGFLARLLIFQSKNDPPRPKFNLDSTVPPELVESISNIWEIKPPIDQKRGNISAVPIPFIIRISSEAEWKWTPWADQMFDVRTEYKDDPVRAPMYGRIAEHAAKLALIHAVSLQGAGIINGGEIGIESVEWATKLMEWLMERMISGISEGVTTNEWHGHQKKIISIIRGCASEGKPGASAAEINKMAHLPVRMLDEILLSLERSEKIHRRSYKPQRGPEKAIFCVSKKKPAKTRA